MDFETQTELEIDLILYGVAILGPDGKRVSPTEFYNKLPFA